METSLKLKKYICFKAILQCKTGLLIGGAESGLGSGGIDKTVIKDTKGYPYIPGSSLKGKMRSILEYKYNKVGINGEPCGCLLPDCPVCKLFGPHKKPTHNLGPSRIIFRDAFLSEKSAKEWENAKKEGQFLTETKMETRINRKTGTAADGSLRTIERVNAGTEFQLNINVRIFEGDDEKRIKEIITEGLSLLDKDYLGGAGTRGYGWVEIKNLEVADC